MKLIPRLVLNTNFSNVRLRHVGQVGQISRTDGETQTLCGTSGAINKSLAPLCQRLYFILLAGLFFFKKNTNNDLKIENDVFSIRIEFLLKLSRELCLFALKRIFDVGLSFRVKTVQVHDAFIF